MTRTRLLLASAVLLAFTAIVGALGLRAARAGRRPLRAHLRARAAGRAGSRRARGQHATAAASAASARTTAQLLLIGALLGGFGLALWFAGGVQRSLRELPERAEQLASARPPTCAHALEAAARAT